MLSHGRLQSKPWEWRDFVSESQTDVKMKVTDRRMFHADGELRDEYRHIEDSPSEESPAEEPLAEEPLAEEPERAEETSGDQPDSARFEDLLSLLAENASIHLQQAQIPGRQQRENLELSRLYIDLMKVLKTKTAGNLTPAEESVLDDVLYRLRMAYAQVQGF
jgi:hypothetical protein